MAHDLTREQQHILFHEQGNLLVSAGAGSGKTTILTKRIVRLIVEKNIPLDRFLVLTFTNAAAQAMKNKIRETLRATSTHKHLASEVDASYIMTFDAFALSLVKRYAMDLDLSPSVSIFDQTILSIEKRTILNTIFDELALQGHPGFKQLIGEYVVKNDQNLINFLLTIDREADLEVDKERYFDTYLKNFFSPAHMQKGIQDLRILIHETLTLFQTETKQIENTADREHILDFLTQLNDFVKLDDFFVKVPWAEESFPRAQNKQSEEDKKIREKIKKQLKKLYILASLESEDQAQEFYLKTKPYITTILTILVELNQRLLAKKKRLNAYSFADIGKMATRLMDDPTRRTAIQNMFDFIMIDEYQDTNDLQEAFISLIAKNNVMMVGDIKQSIYRFRNANCDIFKDKLKRYLPYGKMPNQPESTVLLAKNYRSRKGIIEGINSLFNHTMTEVYGGVDYGLGQALQYGKTDYESYVDTTLKEGVETLMYEEVDGKENAEIQAEIIANHLIDHLNKGAQVYEEDEETKTKSLKPLKYAHVAILIDRKAKFKAYLKVFTERGIPLRIAADQSLSDSDVFRVFKNIMTIIARFHGQDLTDIKQPLMSVLRSFLFEESDERLYQLITGKLSFSDFSAYAIFRQLVKDRTTFTLSQLIEKVFEVFAFETKILKIEDIAGNHARMLQLIALAQQLEQQEYDLDQWVVFMEQADDMDIDLLIGEDRSSQNAVTLMTIHKSKGLEFPIVYIPGTESKFNIQELNAPFLMSKKYGIMLPLPHESYPHTFFRQLVRHQGRMEALSEYLRLFYVATTRAKEKLVLLHPKDATPPLSIAFAYSFQDFIQLAQSKLIPKSQPKLDPIVPTFTMETTEPKQIELGEVEFPTLIQSPLPVEKEFKAPPDQATLDYGNLLHELLFFVDFSTQDTSFIPETKDRKIIEQILRLPLIQSLPKNVYKEYAYVDPSTEKMGIIDMVAIEGKKAIIVDYKTFDIDNPSYDRQLSRYRDYLVGQGFDTVEGHLVSLIQGKTRRVF